MLVIGRATNLFHLLLSGGGGGGGGAVILVKKFRLSNSITAVICSTNLDFVTPWHHCTNLDALNVVGIRQCGFVGVICQQIVLSANILHNYDSYPAKFN